MKKIIALVLVVLSVLSLAACAQPEPAAATPVPASAEATPAETTQPSNAPAGEPIKIGLTTVLTGDRSLEGEYATNGAKIIQQEINDAGGVLGRPIEIVIEDALGTDVGAVNAYKKLADDEDIVAIIGSDSSNDNMAISPDALKAKILTTAQGSSPKLRDMCNNDNPYLFQLRACDQTLCAALIRYAVEEAGCKKFAVMHDTETSSSDQARLFTEALAQYGIEPEIVVSFTTGTKDFTSHIVQVQEKGVDAIIGACFQNEAAILVQQIRAMGIEVPIFGSNAFADPVTLRLAGEAMNGTYCASAWVPTTVSVKGAALAKKYKELYNEDCGKAAAQVYDHVSIICEAITRAGTTDREAVRDAMNTIDNYEGAITRYDCRTNGDCGRGGLLVKVENEVAVILGEITSEKVI